MLVCSEVAPVLPRPEILISAHHETFEASGPELALDEVSATRRSGLARPGGDPQLLCGLGHPAGLDEAAGSALAELVVIGRGMNTISINPTHTSGAHNNGEVQCR